MNGRLYQMENGTVVRVIDDDPDELTLRSQADGSEWTARREPFESDIEAGYIQRVEVAGYTPVSDA